TQRASENREVLREGVGGTSVDEAVAGDHAVAGDALLGHAEVLAAMLHQLVNLLEAPLIEKQVEPLAGRELPVGVLARHAFRAAARLRQLVPPPEFVKPFLERHRKLEVRSQKSETERRPTLTGLTPASSDF